MRSMAIRMPSLENVRLDLCLYSCWVHFFFFFNLELREHFASLETNSLFLTSVETFIFPPPGDLPNLGMEPRSPALQADSLSAEPLGKLPIKCCQYCCLENRVASIILN